MTTTANDRLVPTVSRVCGDTIVELVYDARKRKTALIAARGGNWSISEAVDIPTGETLVPYAASNNLIRHRCVLLPSEPSESGSKAELLADIARYLHRHVDLSPAFEALA